MWTSPDGVTWTRSAHGPTLFGPEPSTIYLAAGAAHGMVAIGSVGQETAAWWSQDTVMWSRLAADEFRIMPAVSDVIGGSEGFVVIGWSQIPPVMIGWPGDGITWRFEPFPGARTRPAGIAAGLHGFIVVGNETVDNAGRESDVAMWTAGEVPDEWSRAADESAYAGPASQVAAFVFCNDGRWFVYGSDENDAGSPAPALWIGSGDANSGC